VSSKSSKYFLKALSTSFSFGKAKATGGNTASALKAGDDYVRANGRIEIDAAIVNNPQGQFLPGAGKTEWFQDAPFAPEMVVIPAGKFLMGSPKNEKDRWNCEGPQHEVILSQPFAVGRYPVTVEEYAYFCVQTKRIVQDVTDKNKHHPVTDVTWDDAKAYAEWLSGVAGAKYRLLSEAEWEYCCRAGTMTRYWFGDEISKHQTNFSRRGTTEVGSYPANGFGLYDMHGNVYEWVEDVWHENYTGAPKDGTPWSDCSSSAHVVRGGSWFSGHLSGYLRSAYRSGNVASSDRLGFRFARTLSGAVCWRRRSI
jgi:formylglycine-generating enzyme required for sulfatase activity